MLIYDYSLNIYPQANSFAVQEIGGKLKAKTLKVWESVNLEKFERNS